MTITFYKNCCLNNKYQEVFYHTKLETYLNSLNKFSLNLEQSYYENNIEIVIDYTWFQSEGGLFVSRNIYDYNYCKITENVGLTIEPNLIRYCFIKSINVKNGCVYLELEEDIWASFSSKIISSNICVLVNSRRKYYEEGVIPTILELPYNYDGNNKLKIESLSYGINSPSVYMLVEFQLYDLNTYSEPNAEREVFYAIVKQLAYVETIDILELKAKILMSSMATNTIRGKNYQIGNIYAIPENLLSISDFAQQDETLFNDLVMRESLNPKEHIILSNSLQNNYKNLFIGTLDNNINLINNGTTIDYEITFSCCSAGISLKLNCSNQIIDITNSFKYDVPFQGILSEEYAARNISNSLKENNLITRSSMEHTKGWTGIGSSILDLLGIFSANFMGAVGTSFKDLSSGIMKIEGVGGGEQSLYDNEKWAVRAPKYSNSKGVINNLNTIANIVYGLIIGKIEPDNAQLVKDFVNNYGFNCYMFLDNFWFTSVVLSDLYGEDYFHYNVIKISSPNVYGSFNNEIANKLNSILENGVKIWYDPSKTEDGYNDDLLN